MAKVLSIDFKAKFNAASHHCERYELVNQKKGIPVLRRGGTFTIDLTLNREIDLKKGHSLKLFFNFGGCRRRRKGKGVREGRKKEKEKEGKIKEGEEERMEGSGREGEWRDGRRGKIREGRG